MTQNIQGWLSVLQLLMQRAALIIIGALAALAIAWFGAALLGLAPALRVQLDLGPDSTFEAGLIIQSMLTLLLVGLCLFLPTSARVLQLERSHRDFKVSMRDVARAYQAVHAADRKGAFEVISEFDSVRDRLVYLREHPDFGHFEPEILEMAAQMSHESRELAELYSDEKFERARCFLRQRQEEAQKFQERVQTAHSVCQDLKRWLEEVVVEEAVARSQLKRLEDDLRELLPLLGLDLVTKLSPEAEPVSPLIAAE